MSARLPTLQSSLRRSRVAGPAGLAVLLLHVGLAWLFIVTGLRHDAASGPSPARLEVHLLPAPLPVTPTPLVEPSGARQAPPLAARRPARDRRTADSAAPAAPRPVDPSAVMVAQPEAASAPPPPASAPLRPLDLTLHPGFAALPSARAQALDALRAPAHVTLEQRISTALGSDVLKEENLGDGRRRFFRNGRCLQSTPTRASTLDPYATLPKPNLIGDC